MNLNPIGAIVESVAKVADDLFTSDEERARLALETYKVDASLVQAQIEVNKAEAASGSLFVGGWRPALGWVGAAAMAYQFIVYPFMVWGWSLMQANGWVSVDLKPPPMLDTDALWVMLSGMLGIAGARTFEKLKGVAR